jgi:DNA-binding transcriptional LysR family regulator
MEFRQLEAFIATVDHRSFSAAAEALYLSQPTISSHIQALEGELQTKLIRRTTKKFEITPEGQQLYEYALALIRLQQKAISELSNTGVRELHIGASSVPGQCILPSILADYRQVYPNSNFRITNADSMDIIQKVESGTLDLGLVGMCTESKHCVFEPFATDELVIAAPNNVYFQTKYGGKFSPQLLKEPMIMRTEQSGTKQEAEHLLQKFGLTDQDLNIVASMNDAEALRNCIIQGLGISIVSHKMVMQQEQQGTLLIYKMDQYVQPRKFYLVYQDGPYLPKAADAFIRHIRHLAEQSEI